MPAPMSENRAFISQYLAIFLAPPFLTPIVAYYRSRKTGVTVCTFHPALLHCKSSNPSYRILPLIPDIMSAPCLIHRNIDSLVPHTGRTAMVRVRMAQFTLQHTYVLRKNTFKCITLSTLLRIILRYLNAWTIGMIDMMVRVLLQSALRRHNERPRPPPGAAHSERRTFLPHPTPILFSSFSFSSAFPPLYYTP